LPLSNLFIISLTFGKSYQLYDINVGLLELGYIYPVHNSIVHNNHTQGIFYTYHKDCHLIAFTIVVSIVCTNRFSSRQLFIATPHRLILILFHHILLFGIIFQEFEGTKSSGHFSHTKYGCHQFTGHHFSLAGIDTIFPTLAIHFIAKFPTHDIILLQAFLTESIIFVTHANFSVIYHTALSIHHTIVSYT